MRVSECMTGDVQLASPTQSLAEVARMMSEWDVGVLPVGQDDRLVGMITDRDIAVRGIGQGRGPEAAVRDVMSSDVCYCFEDQTLEEVAQNMGEVRVRRLPVLNREKHLVGILSLGDISRSTDGEDNSARALRGISQVGGAHSQTS